MYTNIKKQVDDEETAEPIVAADVYVGDEETYEEALWQADQEHDVEVKRIQKEVALSLSLLFLGFLFSVLFFHLLCFFLSDADSHAPPTRLPHPAQPE